MAISKPAPTNEVDRHRSADAIEHVQEAAEKVMGALESIRLPYGNTLIVHSQGSCGGRVIIAVANTRNSELDELITAAKALMPSEYS